MHTVLTLHIALIYIRKLCYVHKPTKHILSSCYILNYLVTLFELMVVNNWWIIMEGFHNQVPYKHARPFFMAFHLTTAVSCKYI